MSTSEKENPRSPEHLEAQRNRILDAAEECFIRYGFHAASMSRIAETAGVSQGLAYRYFKNKNAIILAIIERQLERRHSFLAESDNADTFAQGLLELIDSWSNQEKGKISPVLFMEMCAEASRDDEIRQAMATADKTYLGDFRSWMLEEGKRREKKVSEQEIYDRFYALQALIEGAALLAARRKPHDAVGKNAVFLALIRRILDF